MGNEPGASRFGDQARQRTTETKRGPRLLFDPLEDARGQ